MDDCLIWQGSRSANGYGRVWDTTNSVNAYAHRMAYEREHGPIPSGYVVHHRCNESLCVNVEHLELMVHGEHSQHHNPLTSRYVNGHERTPENTYTNPASGQRICRTCQREWTRRYYHRQKESA